MTCCTLALVVRTIPNLVAQHSPKVPEWLLLQKVPQQQELFLILQLSECTMLPHSESLNSVTVKTYSSWWSRFYPCISPKNRGKVRLWKAIQGCYKGSVKWTWQKYIARLRQGLHLIGILPLTFAFQDKAKKGSTTSKRFFSLSPKGGTWFPIQKGCLILISLWEYMTDPVFV